MSEIIHRTRLNPAGRGSKKRLTMKSPMKEPPRPMNWEPNKPLKRKSNTTTGKSRRKQKTSTNQDQAPKNGRDRQQEITGIPQKLNNKTIQRSAVGKLVTNNIHSSDSDSDSESDSEDKLLMTPNLVDHEVSKKYKTSINSNLTDDTINGEEFHSANTGRLEKLLKANTGRLEKLLKDLTEDVKKITGATEACERHSTCNVTEDGENRVMAETIPPFILSLIHI